MIPIQTNLNTLIKHFTTFVLNKEKCDIDVENPDFLNLDFFPEYDVILRDSENPSFHISVNNVSLVVSAKYYIESIIAALNEIYENLKMPIKHELKKDYLLQVLSKIEKLDNEIVEKDSILISNKAVCNNFEISSLEDNFKEEIDKYFYKLKNELREVIRIITDLIQRNDFDLDGAISPLPFKRIQIKSDINLIATLFYDLLDEKYIDTTKANLRRFLTACFLDNNRQPLSDSTINTYLKPGKEDKRTSNDKRIPVPPR
jgi:hypothetical protein